jgi:hypothetical protein
MDTWYLGYLRVRVAYLITKTLEPKLRVRIKARDLMEIILSYENVPHFYFSCGLGRGAIILIPLENT